VNLAQRDVYRRIKAQFDSWMKPRICRDGSAFRRLQTDGVEASAPAPLALKPAAMEAARLLLLLSAACNALLVRMMDDGRVDRPR